jgi:thiol-disulfide isomerase/thioredoxin
MQAYRLCAGLFALALFLLPNAPVLAQDKVEVKVVKYPELAATISNLKGKVVVVDFWADWWLVCKKEFPHLVEMQKKYAKDALAAVSVSLDDPKDKKATQNVLDFLRKQKATFTNLILDEKSEVWQEKLKFDGPPCVFVFDRDGKWKKYDSPDYADIEKYAVGLLKK